MKTEEQIWGFASELRTRRTLAKSIYEEELYRISSLLLEWVLEAPLLNPTAKDPTGTAGETTIAYFFECVERVSQSTRDDVKGVG